MIELLFQIVFNYIYLLLNYMKIYQNTFQMHLLYDI